MEWAMEVSCRAWENDRMKSRTKQVSDKAGCTHVPIIVPQCHGRAEIDVLPSKAQTMRHLSDKDSIRDNKRYLNP